MKNFLKSESTKNESSNRGKIPVIKIVILFAVMAVIFIHSAMPGLVTSSESNVIVNPIVDLTHSYDTFHITVVVRKSAHFIEFLVLGLCLMAVIGKSGKPKWKHVLIAWLIGTVYAVSDEIHQYFVPGRSAMVRDVCIDAAGVAVGVLILFIIMWKRSRT